MTGGRVEKAPPALMEVLRLSHLRRPAVLASFGFAAAAARATYLGITWDEVVRRTEEIYRDLLGRERPRRRWVRKDRFAREHPRIRHRPPR